MTDQTGVWIEILDDHLDSLKIRMGRISGQRENYTLCSVYVSTWEKNDNN